MPAWCDRSLIFSFTRTGRRQKAPPQVENLLVPNERPRRKRRGILKTRVDVTPQAAGNQTRKRLNPAARAGVDCLTIHSIFLAGVDHGVQILRIGIVDDRAVGEDVSAVAANIIDQPLGERNDLLRR